MNQYNSYTYLLFALTFASCANHSETEKIRAEALSSFEIAEGFQIELIASEPLISDPVAMEIDEDGNMYVVEMHGYPLDKSGSGNVKLLTDTDGDGEMDKVSLFANDLLFPTGVMRWKKGIMVTDPPNVLYFEDTDNDGVADIRDTLLHGFSISNPQHNVNSPMLGLDNWIYIANESAVAAKVYTEEFSDPGSELHFYKQPDAPSLGVNGGGRRIRFKPDELKLEATSSRSQFGQTYDKWGHHFLNSNANHIYQEVIAASYLERNPDLQISNSTEIISDHGHAAEVFPITLNPQHQLLTDLGVFTSACGITAYGGGLFPKEFENSVFVSEPVSNLVHVDIVQEKGSTHVASRKYEQQEFLASKDPWSRPVNNYVGPDGALYVVDYYRRIVEHPEWMSDDVVESGIVYDGVDQGRIYRITPKGTKPANWTRDFSMSDLSNKELVNYLNNPNSWFRRTAQRLILDRSDKSIKSELTELVRTKEASLGRLHAAWTMEGLNVLTTEIIIDLLKDPVAGIRENAILLSESFLDKEEVVTALLGLQNDENPRVRFQLMCTLGYIDSPKANKVRLEMGIENVEDYWIQIASLSSSSPDLVGLLDAAINHYQKDEKSYKKYISKIVSMISRQNNTAEIKNLIQRALKSNLKESEGWRIAILQGLMAGKSNVDYKSLTFERERKLLYGIVFSNHFKELKETSLSFLTAMGLPVDINIGNAIEKALVVVKSTKSSEEDRILAIQFLALTDYPELKLMLEQMLIPKESIAVQKIVLKTLSTIQGEEFPSFVIGKWNSFLPNLRDEGIRLLLSNEKGTIELIKALEAGTVDPSAIPWPRQVGMMAQADDNLRLRSREIFSNKVNDVKKEKVLEQYSDISSLKGDVDKGLEVFKINCATCHQIGGEYGTAYGPDLASIRSRKPESIVKDILDPGLSIADGYDLWEVKLINGETKQGIISSETSNSINLRVLGSSDEVLSRSDIEGLTAKNISVMPAGLESQISINDMADLLAFIKKLKK